VVAIILIITCGAWAELPAIFGDGSGARRTRTHDGIRGNSAWTDQIALGASRKLEVAQSRDQVKTVVESLAKSTREMRDTKKALG